MKLKSILQSAKSLMISPERKSDMDRKSMNAIIEEIHESFYTEVDKLLASANISNSLETVKQDLISKYERLKKLGFTNTKESDEAHAEIERLKSLKRENDRKSELIAAINYFSVKYPEYKFITEESVKTICEKYNLIYGDVSRYIGTVPDKNLKHIEDFKISEDDCAYIEEMNYNRRAQRVTIISKDSYEKSIKEGCRSYFGDIDYKYSKAPLEIAGPVKDFNLEGYELKDFKISEKIEIPDPVVLQPVIYKSVKYYLIVTAWGTEASDELVLNQLNN